MVNVQRVRRARPQEPASDPYRLLSVSVNGSVVDARPIAFDSGPDGLPVAANRVITQCPDCGAGVEYDLGGDLDFSCYHCARVSVPEHGFAAKLAPYDPFVNPFLEGLLGHEEADSDLVGLLGDREVESSTARQRMAFRAIPELDTSGLDAAMASLDDEDIGA